MNTEMHVSFRIRVFIFSGYMPKSEITGSYGSFIFLFFEEPPYCFPQWMHKLTFPPRVQEGLLFSTPFPAFICRLFDDGHSDSHEKILNITDYQRNANQNHNEVSSHAGQNGCYQKVYKQMLERVRKKKNPLTLLVGMQTSTATMENSMEIP